MKRVLILGAGLVVKPLLDDVLSLPDVEVHLATLNIERARQLVLDRGHATALEVNAAEETQLAPEVASANVVVSLLPADQHVRIAEFCLRFRVPLVTTSYISEEMRALDARARQGGILLLNEAGLDPGIDHITAVQVIRRVHREGGQIVSFASFCGGMPSPESNTNPWGYKFAWSPRGVVLAARNPVRYLAAGAMIERSFPDLFDSPQSLEVAGVGRLEAYPNRDCLRYLAPYGLAAVRDFFRGTLRYPGWCQTWRSLSNLGLLDTEPLDWAGQSYGEFLNHYLGGGRNGVVERLARRLGVHEDHDVIARLEWLGLLSDRPIPETHASPLDIITSRLQRKLRYHPGEHDLVVLLHRFTATRADGTLRTITKQLIISGDAGDESAMAKCVSYPAAIACRLLLDKQVDISGVQIPVDPQLTDPILLGLERRGLHIEEREYDGDVPVWGQRVYPVGTGRHAI